MGSTNATPRSRSSQCADSDDQSDDPQEVGALSREVETLGIRAVKLRRKGRARGRSVKSRSKSSKSKSRKSKSKRSKSKGSKSKKSRSKTRGKSVKKSRSKSKASKSKASKSKVSKSAKKSTKMSRVPGRKGRKAADGEEMTVFNVGLIPGNMQSIKFNSFLKKVLRGIRPELSMGGETTRMVDSLVKNCMDYLANEASERMGKRKTMSEKQLSKAVKKCLPKGLRESVDEMAMDTFKRFKEDKLKAKLARKALKTKLNKKKRC